MTDRPAHAPIHPLWDDRRVRLAVVEDDDGVGDALVEALNARGYRAERKRRGADLLMAHRGYDAVILDLGLPDADGLQILRQLREVSQVPVLILTARSDERSIVRGLRGGADDYLVKPPRIAELMARLETVTRRAAARRNRRKRWWSPGMCGWTYRPAWSRWAARRSR